MTTASVADTADLYSSPGHVSLTHSPVDRLLQASDLREDLARLTCSGAGDQTVAGTVTSQGTVTSSQDSDRTSNADPLLSPTSPTSRVGFCLEPEVVFKSKEQERFLTAKYPRHQMGLIRKRLAVEDWVDVQLKQLFNISDADYETYDTIIDLDELLNFDSDVERSEYIQQKISKAPKPTTVLSKFTEELLQKANTL